MDDDFESHRTFSFKMIKTKFTPENSPLLQIKFNFFFENNLSQWVLNGDSTAVYLVGQSSPRIIEDFVHITLRKFLCYDETCEEIDRELMYLPLTDDERKRLIEFAWNEALETIKSKPISGYALLDLDFQLLIETRQVFGSPYGSIESCMFNDSSKLKKHDIDSGNTEVCCSICLEDLSDKGGEATWLPCSHGFHGGCIKKWLRITNNCPLCRFEMPMATS